MADFTYTGDLPLALVPESAALGDYRYAGDIVISLTPESVTEATYGYTGTITVTLSPASDFDGKFNYTGNLSITIGSTGQGIVLFIDDLPFVVRAAVFIDGVNYSEALQGTITVIREDNAAATFDLTINSTDRPAEFMDKEISVSFQAADGTGEVADYVPVFVGVVKGVSWNEDEGALNLRGYDYGGVHGSPGERISADITVVHSGSLYVSDAGTYSAGFSPVWGVSYLGSDDIVDGRDYFVDTLNGEIVVPISTNFRRFPGALSYRYATYFPTLRGLMQAVADMKGWVITEDGVTLEDYTSIKKQPVLSISNESIIDIMRKFLELSGAKIETNLFPAMRVYSETINLVGADKHVLDNTQIYEGSLNFNIGLEGLLNEQTVRSVAKTFANIEIGGWETLPQFSGAVAYEFVYGNTVPFSIFIEPKVLGEVRVSKDNIFDISITASGTFTYPSGSFAIQNSDWEQTTEDNQIVYKLKRNVFLLKQGAATNVYFPKADWGLTVQIRKINYGDGTIEETVEVTGSRPVSGLTQTLAGDVYENPYLETTAMAGNLANAILTEAGNVYDMSCEAPLHEAFNFEIGDKLNIRRASGETIFKGIIKRLQYSLNLETAEAPVSIAAKGIGFGI